ncbi:MAG: EamA family transporter [Candidatus Levyibacteriota bacterium]
MFTNWIFLAALSGICSNIFNFSNRFFLKDKDDPIAYAWFYEAFQFLVYAVFAIVFDWKIIFNLHSILLLLALGITEFISVYWYMKMHAYSHLSISTIISRTRLIWIPLIGLFLLSEHLRIMDYLGFAILFIGLSVVVAPHKFFVDKGAKYANLSAFMIALNTVILKIAVPFGSGSVLMMGMTLPSVILFPLLMKKAKKRLFISGQKNFLLKIAAISTHIVSAYLFIFALRHGEVSKVNAIYQGMMITSVIGGIVFLGEKKDIGKKLLGSIVTIVGVILLTSF